ncbi:MAG: prevent-host-death family protein [Armatimonadetes bacterium CG_4_10_14_3_um_filter_66_18]|nr:type II toxin-antitoxin system Phd/YefM family antitoxin [Armatimonadota bacterium]OIO91747.1 MAG: hypothetical protein AUJ96_33330 [Armatimonadetes bacterium CG2_30_66_41]PIU88124.1 MAG: prevent-host-death family protein [Armatimonadetes bacterium CG06_land_8_20_14_3_00_66_21]PIY49158.1 MAG: prevent-host-death family protein [Armatimonadetes bacterium CG_4_10_14_3_um_filter_66_18]PIZ43662.1 MAG: prevent-host-death family protein [Armatimonadetes bacterium CG_4_10_14_0_8_um_filter_66_14]PJB
MRAFSIAEARNRLPSLVHEVEAGPAVELTRHGHAAAVLLFHPQYHKLTEKRAGFWDALRGFRWPDPDTFEGLRDKSPGREQDLF